LLGADISVVMHVRLSVHLSVLLLEKLYTLWGIFIKWWKYKFVSIWHRIRPLCMERHATVLRYPTESFSSWENFQLNFVQNILSHVSYQVYFFLKIIFWDGFNKYDSARQTKDTTLYSYRCVAVWLHNTAALYSYCYL
jgi:hypothetical protein